MPNIVLSCEHAHNTVPKYSGLVIPKALLKTHRAYDIGALSLGKSLAKSLKRKIFFSKVSRLVIDYNRSLHNPKIWSSFSKKLSSKNKAKLTEEYKKYRDLLHSEIKSSKTNVHLSIHSFTPQLNGEVRNAEIGILYDSRVKKESELAIKFVEALKKQGFSTRKNYPYLGKSDGICSEFRRAYPKKYLGFEIEVNQSIILDTKKRAEIVSALCSVLKAL